MSQARVIEVTSEEILFSCEMSEIDKAYDYAKEMEDLGLEVKVISPNVNETLAQSLGATEQEWQDYKQSMEQEMDDHDGCCVESV